MVRVSKLAQSISAWCARKIRRIKRRYTAECKMAKKLWKRGWLQKDQFRLHGELVYDPLLPWLKDQVEAKDVYEACHIQAVEERKAKEHLKPENMAKHLIDKGWKQNGPLADVWTIPHWDNKNYWGRPYEHVSSEACFTLHKAYRQQLKLETRCP